MCFESRGYRAARGRGGGRAGAAATRHCTDLARGCAGKGPTQPDTVANGCSGPLATVLRASNLSRAYEVQQEGGFEGKVRKLGGVVVDIDVSWKGGQGRQASW